MKADQLSKGKSDMTMIPRDPKKIRKKPFLSRNDLLGWMVMLPSLVLFTFFVWEPLLESVHLSFYSAKGFRLGKELSDLADFLKF